MEEVQDRVEGNADQNKNLKPFPTDPAVVDGEIADLKNRFQTRNNPLAQASLSRFLKDPAYTARPPVGAVHNACRSCSPFLSVPFVSTGGDLARLFEAETPGLWHRHVL